MKTLVKAILCGCSVCMLANKAVARDQAVVDAGDALRYLLPASAYLGTLITRDKEGAIMFTKSLATQGIIIAAGKEIAVKFRPNGTSRKSFPSGHTGAAFSGAAFLYSRYGRTFGIPAYALAAFTGYSRVDADAHHVDDVLAGMSIGLFSNWYWVSPHESRVTAYPSVYNDNYYLNLKIAEDPGKKSKADRSQLGKYRYSLYFGPADQRTNIVRSPNTTGTEFNLITFSERNDPTTTANVRFDARIGERSSLQLSIEPFEARDIGRFNQPVNFAGGAFPANTDIFSRYRLTDIRLLYQYDLLTTGKLDLKLGAARVEDGAYMPLLNLAGIYNLDSNMALVADTNWISTSDDDHFDATLMFSYQFDRHWDAGFG